MSHYTIMVAEDIESNVMTAWIKEQANVLNKPYGEIQRILLIPTARGHKQMFSKWSDFKKTLPLSKPLQRPVQPYRPNFENVAPPEYYPYEPETETEKKKKGKVVWRDSDDISRWYIPKAFQKNTELLKEITEPELTEKQKIRIERLKKDRKNKKKILVIEDEEEGYVPPAPKTLEEFVAKVVDDEPPGIDAEVWELNSIKERNIRNMRQMINGVRMSSLKLQNVKIERRISELERGEAEPLDEGWYKFMRDTEKMAGLPENERFDWNMRIQGEGIAVRGGKLSATNLRGLLDASYSGQEKVGDFILDKRLSTLTSKVYYNPSTTQVVVAHKGTEGVLDWANNLAYALGGRWAYEKTPRYKEAKKVQREAEEAYGTKNLSTIGHSQGALQADLLGQRGKEVITLNKPSHPLEKSSSSIQTDIRTKRDPVSIFTDADITIESEGYNPLTEHSVDTLGRLDPEMMIGEGLKRLNKTIHHYKKCLGMSCPPLIPTPEYRNYVELLKNRNAHQRLLKIGFSK